MVFAAMSLHRNSVIFNRTLTATNSINVVNREMATLINAEILTS